MDCWVGEEKRDQNPTEGSIAAIKEGINLPSFFGEQVKLPSTKKGEEGRGKFGGNRFF